MVNDPTFPTASFNPSVVYRQRLTPAGWIGTLLAIAMPIVASFFVYQFWNAWSEAQEYIARGYSILADDPERRSLVSAACALFASLLSAGGLVMILVGREYFAHALPVEEGKSGRKPIDGYLANGNRESKIV